MSDSLKKQSNLLIYQPVRFAHIRSFVLSDLSKLLTFSHLSWAIWANEWMSEFPSKHLSTSVTFVPLHLSTSVPCTLVHLYNVHLYSTPLRLRTSVPLVPPLLSSSVPCLPLHLSLSVPYVMYLMQLSTSVLFMHLHPSTSAHFGSLYLCTSVPSVILVPSKDRFQFLIPLSWCVHIRGQTQNRKSSTADTEMQRHNYFLWLFGLIQTRVEQILPAAISLFCTTEVSHWWRKQRIYITLRMDSLPPPLPPNISPPALSTNIQTDR